MISNPKLSIIVPIYQVEKYICNCVDSILNQNYGDFELLLVDDGSFDSSGKICDELSKKDLRIKVFHKKNSGVSSARNLGLIEAKGDYVFFVDADDWIEKDSLSILKNHKLEYYDLIHFGYSIIGTNKSVIKESVPDMERGFSIKEYLSMNVFEHVLWVYFFKREIIVSNNLFFNTEVKLAEDWDFIIRYLNHIRFVYLLNQKIYCYFNRVGSASHSKISIDTFNHNLIIVESFLINSSKYIDKKFIYKETQKLLSYYLSNVAYIEMSVVEKMNTIDLYRKIFIKYSILTKIDFLLYFKFILPFISFNIYVNMYKLYKKIYMAFKNIRNVSNFREVLKFK